MGLPYILDLNRDLFRMWKAYKEGNLGAQRDTYDTCMYQYPDGSNCAIGSILPQHLIDHLKTIGMNGGVVTELFELKKLWCKDSKDEEIYVELQNLHDVWQTAGNRNTAEARFLNYLTKQMIDRELHF